MSSLTAYEIQAYTGGKWQIQAIFNDKDLALLEARRLEKAHRYSAVRVVEEMFDKFANATVSRTIFRGSAVEDHNKKTLERQAQVRRDVREARSKSKAARNRAEAKATEAGRETSLLAIILMFIAIMALGVGAVVALRHFVGGG